jgi:hypothetical protein
MGGGTLEAKPSLTRNGAMARPEMTAPSNYRSPDPDAVIL